ncbi:MAG: flagellar basal body P-ring formation chaperone FlgA [Pseudomonadota bacterium]
MPWPQGTVRVSFLSMEPETVPQGKYVTIRVEPPSREDFIGDMVFLVRIFKGGNYFRTETVRTRIEVIHDVVIATRTLSSGTVLKHSDINAIRKWVHRIHPQTLFSADRAVGRRLTVQTRPGMEITTNMLKDVPLVQRGKIVKIIFDSGPMRIVTVGIPEEDGMAGSIIRVRNVTSNKIIYARVLGDSMVGIEI